MQRRVDNPPNPFVADHCAWLEEPPAAPIEIYEERAKSIIASNDSPDVPFTYSANPYRGCQHACAYCYARPTHEYLGLGAGSDFDTKITVKINAPELLDTALSRRSWKHESIVFSGVTDCYQPYEAVYQLTRRCLEVCLRHANPIGVITKSFLVARDAELLAELNHVAQARVFLSIPFADDVRSRLIEPGAPPSSRRFEALRRLHAAGVPVGVMVAPIIPGLNDRDAPTILERAAECGAQWAGYTALRLPGSVEPVFLSRLQAALPDAARAVELRIRGMRGGALSDPRFGARMRGSGEYWNSIEQLFQNSARRLGYRGRESCAGNTSSGRTPSISGKANPAGRAQPAHPPRAAADVAGALTPTQDRTTITPAAQQLSLFEPPRP